MDIEYHNDHNVYILGAGFSYEAGYPLVRNFMDKMKEAASWQKDHSQETKEIEAVLKFRLEAAAAAYRIQFDPENIEDLFSLSVAKGGSDGTTNRNVILAIAETLEYCRNANIDKNVIFPGAPNPPPKGFSLDNKENPSNIIIDRFKFYIGIMTGIWGETPYKDNTFITFNYDLLLEDALKEWTIPFRYDGLHGYEIPGLSNFDDSARSIQENEEEENVVSILKLHGSVNWALTGLPPNSLIKKYIGIKGVVKVYGDFIRKEMLGSQQALLLAPPVWDKGIAKVGHPLAGVWSNAVKKFQTATRIIVIGYSLPFADAHFRYLMAAGLQNNISLREIVFVNPAFREEDPNKEALEERVFSVFIRDLQKKGILKLLPFMTHEFFFPSIAKGIKTEDILGRKYPLPFH